MASYRITVFSTSIRIFGYQPVAYGYNIILNTKYLAQFKNLKEKYFWPTLMVGSMRKSESCILISYTSQPSYKKRVLFGYLAVADQTFR